MAIFHLGGAAAEVDEMAMAASHRDSEYILAINNGWRDPADSKRQVRWTRDFWEAIRPFSTGAYVNFMSADAEAARVKAGYGPEKHARLAELKNRYDPHNFFRLNQNIQPNGSTR